MGTPDRSGLPEALRKAIFLAVVDAQDGGTPVALSRQKVAADFGVTEGEVRLIEEEGADAGWPPLG